MSVLWNTAPELVLVVRVLPVPVLKIAQGAASSVWPNPACWNGSPLKMPTNSSRWPGFSAAVSLQLVPSDTQVPMRAPSTKTAPSAATDVPPLFHGTDSQPEGSAVPENSAPLVGARRSSPSMLSET